MVNINNIFNQIFDQILIYIVLFTGLIVILILLFKVGVWLIKQYMRMQIMFNRKHAALLKISVSKHRDSQGQSNQQGTNNKTNQINVAEQMFAELRGIIPSDWRKHLIFRETLTFEIVATATEINFYMFCSRRLVNYVKNSIFAAYPDAEISEVPDYIDSLLKINIVYGYIRLIGPEYSPIRSYETLTNDSLNIILSKMSNLRGNEIIALQTYITPVSGSWRQKAYRYLEYLMGGQKDKTNQQDKGQDSTVWVGNSLQMAVDSDLYSGIEKKMNKKGYLVGIRVISGAKDKKTAQFNFDSLVRSYSLFDVPPLTSFQGCQFWLANISLLKYFKLRMQPYVDWPFFHQQFIANTEELATICHLPGEEVTVPKITWLRYKTAPASSELPSQGFFIGYNSYRNYRKKIFLPEEDRRRHFYIVGQTGTGKSEYLKNMTLQDINNGRGVCFLDPHGDVAEDILTKIPKERINDVIYWNPADTKYPIGMNIMDVDSVEEKNIIINSFIALLYKLYDPNHTGIMGPMLERTVRNVMLTAMEEKGNTLVESLRLLTSPSFAKSKIENIKDPIIKTYWTEEMARTTDFHKSETLGYYVSKFDRFITDQTLRNIIGQSKSAFDFQEIMDKGKILIINLSKGKLGEENTAFLGTLIIPKFIIAAMKRANQPENMRRDYYFYIDEFQNFATPDFIEILSEARKYRLNLIIANQYISQITEEVRNAVFGNVGSIGAFRVGVDDAQYLINNFKPVFNEYDLINNGIGNLYIRPLINGKPSEPFSVSLNWKEVQSIISSSETAELIIQNTRQKYARPQNEIEAEIINRAQLFDKTSNPIAEVINKNSV